MLQAITPLIEIDIVYLLYNEKLQLFMVPNSLYHYALSSITACVTSIGDIRWQLFRQRDCQVQHIPVWSEQAIGMSVTPTGHKDHGRGLDDGIV